MRRALPFLALVVALYVLAPRGFPATSEVRPTSAPAGGGSSAASLVTGVPSNVIAGGSGSWLPNPETGAPTNPSQSLPVLTPRPTGQIGNPATFWKPGYKPRPTPRVVVSKGSVIGDATYYCRPGISRCTVNHPFGMYAAAGPEVRAMLGPDWRGQFVIVTDETGRGVVVQLIDFCACSGNHVIDLYWTAYRGLVNPVIVSEEP